MITLRVYSLNSFHVRHTVGLAAVMMRTTSPVLIDLITERLYFLAPSVRFLLPPSLPFFLCV